MLIVFVVAMCNAIPTVMNGAIGADLHIVSLPKIHAPTYTNIFSPSRLLLELAMDTGSATFALYHEEYLPCSGSASNQLEEQLLSPK